MQQRCGGAFEFGDVGELCCKRRGRGQAGAAMQQALGARHSQRGGLQGADRSAADQVAVVATEHRRYQFWRGYDAVAVAAQAGAVDR